MKLPRNQHLRFYLDTDAPDKIRMKWNRLRVRCMTGDFPLHIDGYPSLDREEGGIGGDDNTIHKQIRWRGDWNLPKHSQYYDDAIVLFVSSTAAERWTLEELKAVAETVVESLETVLSAIHCVRSFLAYPLN